MLYDIIKYGLMGVGGTLVTSYIIENEMRNVDTIVEQPADTVSVIMPSYNEEMFIVEACKSIRNQSIIQQYPQYFEFILVDSNSTDKTVELAKLYVDKVIMAGRGKLTARNLATDQAKGNIIVAVDSDSLYADGWLNTLLKPFKNPEVVATNGSIFDYSVPLIPGQVHTIADYIHYGITNINELNGGNSAYKKEAFYKVGRFNENINQMDFRVVSQEEEIDFGQKLSNLGKIVFVLNAPKVHLGGIKVGCRNALSNAEACELMGIGKSRF